MEPLKLPNYQASYDKLIFKFREQTFTSSVVEIVNEVLPTGHSHVPQYEQINWVKIQRFPSGLLFVF
jgi:hypothetical protein